MLKAPCGEKCKNRHIGCHAVCFAYRLFRHAKLKAYRKAKAMINAYGLTAGKEKLIWQAIKRKKK